MVQIWKTIKSYDVDYNKEDWQLREIAKDEYGHIVRVYVSKLGIRFVYEYNNMVKTYIYDDKRKKRNLNPINMDAIDVPKHRRSSMHWRGKVVQLAFKYGSVSYDDLTKTIYAASHQSFAMRMARLVSWGLFYCNDEGEYRLTELGTEIAHKSQRGRLYIDYEYIYYYDPDRGEYVKEKYR